MEKKRLQKKSLLLCKTSHIKHFKCSIKLEFEKFYKIFNTCTEPVCKITFILVFILLYMDLILTYHMLQGLIIHEAREAREASTLKVEN